MTLIPQVQQAALSKPAEYKREKNGNVFNVTTRGGKKNTKTSYPSPSPSQVHLEDSDLRFRFGGEPARSMQSSTV